MSPPGDASALSPRSPADQGQTVPPLILEAVLSSKMAAGVCPHRTSHRVLLPPKPDPEMGESRPPQHCWTGAKDGGRAHVRSHPCHTTPNAASHYQGPSYDPGYGLHASRVLALQRLHGRHGPVPTKEKSLQHFHSCKPALQINAYPRRSLEHPGSCRGRARRAGGPEGRQAVQHLPFQASLLTHMDVTGTGRHGSSARDQRQRGLRLHTHSTDSAVRGRDQAHCVVWCGFCLFLCF